MSTMRTASILLNGEWSHTVTLPSEAQRTYNSQQKAVHIPVKEVFYRVTTEVFISVVLVF